MLCEKPFVRRPVGVTAKELLLSDEARMAVTPFGCGRCLPCRINRSRVWKHRILLEGLVHDKLSFVTLTYDDDHLPIDGNLVPEDATKFLKRLRYYFNGRPIRYFLVGEYGERSQRPHFHAILFGVCFTEEEVIKKAWCDEAGQAIGFVKAGDVSPASISYVVGYAVKGWTNKGIEKLNGRHPEFMRCSKGSKDYPGGLGIGAIKQVARCLQGRDVGVISKLRRGMIDYPLGRYLRTKLAEEMGISELKLKEDFMKYQEEFVAEHGHKDLPLDSFLDSIDGKLRQIKARHRVFSKGKSL